MTPTPCTPEEPRDPLNTSHLKQELKARSIRGTLLVLLSQGGKFLLQFVAMIVMAHLVSPADFGLFSIVFAITTFGLMFKDGLAMSTVQREELSHTESSSLFWVNVAIGLTLAAVTCMAAPLVAIFYHQPVLTPLIVAMCSMYVFSYLASQQLAVLRRQMRFGALVTVDQIAMLISISIGIFCAWKGCGVWSLAAVQISLSVCSCAGAWIVSEWRPGRYVANPELRALLLFGKHVAGSDLVTYLTRNFDNLLIGWSCGMTPLGFYDRAYGLMMVPTQQLLGPISGVAVSTLSRLQNETERYLTYSKNTITVCAGLGMPACAFLFIGAHRLIPCLLGDQWRDAAPILQALAPGAFVDSFIVGLSAILLSSGKTREYFRYRAYAAVLAVAGFFLGVHWGPTGVAAALSLSRLVVCVIVVRLACQHTAVSWKDMRVSASAPFMAAIGSGSIITACGSLIDAAGDARISLLINAVSFSVLYLAIWAVLPGGVRSISQIAALRFERSKSGDSTTRAAATAGDAACEQETVAPV